MYFRVGKSVVNWGLGRDPWPPGISDEFRVVNKFNAVAVACNKLMTFEVLSGVGGVCIPEYTTTRAVALFWTTEGRSVVCRTTLRGHSGEGIIMSGPELDLPTAPLYVQYVKKAKEFRVHVAFNEVIDVQEKRKRRGFEDANYQVRNHHNGWVYCREDIQEPEGMRDMAIRTVRALGLDFGAVDIIWNAKQNQCYVLEVNTAPGLEGETINKYTDAFIKELA